MTDKEGNPMECKTCADVVDTPPTSAGFGWCPKVELGLDEPEATDEQMEALDRDIAALESDRLNDRLAEDLEDHGSSNVLRDANNVLDTAKHLVNNGRRTSYGHPMDNFDRIRRGWEVILGIPISRRQVAKCQAWTKIARDVETENTGDAEKMMENAIDLCGYGSLMEEVR